MAERRILVDVDTQFAVVDARRALHVPAPVGVVDRIERSLRAAVTNGFSTAAIGASDGQAQSRRAPTGKGAMWLPA